MLSSQCHTSHPKTPTLLFLLVRFTIIHAVIPVRRGIILTHVLAVVVETATASAKCLPSTAIAVNVVLAVIQADANAITITTAILIAVSIDILTLASACFVGNSVKSKTIIVTFFIRPREVAGHSVDFTASDTLSLAVSTEVPVARVGVGVRFTAFFRLARLAGTFVIFFLLGTVWVGLGTALITFILTLFGCGLLKVDDLILG
mmetsp:Transcript_21087/g.34491  ORF Transcript_21087/g.34491 Transcript_21087/m.34491 type:complete len:204 (-) Transcript_21087:874-1485(-)